MLLNVSNTGGGIHGLYGDYSCRLNLKMYYLTE